MRTAALTLLSFVAFMNATHAQKFSLLPQLGFENSKANIRYNNLPSFSPSGVVFSPQATVQLNYSMKSGHGFYLGAATSRSTIAFRFSDPETGMNTYQTNTGNMQVRMEGGYRFSSKPLFFKKSGQAPALRTEKTAVKKNCGSYSYRSYCTKSNSGGSNAGKAVQPLKRKGMGAWVKWQPSVGMGLVPDPVSDVITTMQNGNPVYEYRAGNWNTALMTGMAFEFGKNNNRLVTVGFNYVRGLGNLNTQTISTVSGTKTLTTQLKSDLSAWNMRIGVPFTLGGKKQAPKASQKVNTPRTGCSQYKLLYRCSKVQ